MDQDNIAELIQHESQNKNQITIGKFSNETTEHEHRQKTAGDKWIEDQCGRCSFFAPLNQDWGLCCFNKSKYFTETINKHFGCERHIEEGWQAHSFQERKKLQLDTEKLLNMLTLSEQILSKIQRDCLDSDSHIFLLKLGCFLRKYKNSIIV
jgi:hypothetical protein